MKRILMVAFHFPPAAASSGIQRSLRFVQHLPALGWEPVVLTAHARAHERVNLGLLADVPSGIQVVSAFALDTARHLAVAGRYPAFLARPDRWQLWRHGAVAAGLKLMRSTRFDALWSTYPIPTAHRIAADLHARTGVPWIADFRDPMAQEGYPTDPKTWAQYQTIERHAIHTAVRSVFTTPGAAAMYRGRYPEVSDERIVVIENGYDEDTFAAAQRPAGATRVEGGPLVLLHSGVVYPSERDPTQLMAALAMLQARGTIQNSGFRIRFRASEHDAMLADLARRAGVDDLIELAPAVPYKDALGEMLSADALLVLQASNCNAQVPAKLYEYLRAGRPILALTDPAGDTAQVLARAGVPQVARLDSAQEIADLIAAFVSEPAQRPRWIAQEPQVRQASRRARAAELAALLDGLAAPTR